MPSTRDAMAQIGVRALLSEERSDAGLRGAVVPNPDTPDTPDAPDAPNAVIPNGEAGNGLALPGLSELLADLD